MKISAFFFREYRPGYWIGSDAWDNLPALLLGMRVSLAPGVAGRVTECKHAIEEDNTSARRVYVVIEVPDGALPQLLTGFAVPKVLPVIEWRDPDSGAVAT